MSFPVVHSLSCLSVITAGAGEKTGQVQSKAKQKLCGLVSGPSGGIRCPKAGLFLQFLEDRSGGPSENPLPRGCLSCSSPVQVLPF